MVSPSTPPVFPARADIETTCLKNKMPRKGAKISWFHRIASVHVWGGLLQHLSSRRIGHMSSASWLCFAACLEARAGWALLCSSWVLLGKYAGKEESTHYPYFLLVSAQSMEYPTGAFFGCCFKLVQGLGMFIEVLCKWKCFVSSVFNAVLLKALWNLNEPFRNVVFKREVSKNKIFPICWANDINIGMVNWANILGIGVLLDEYLSVFVWNS